VRTRAGEPGITRRPGGRACTGTRGALLHATRSAAAGERHGPPAGQGPVSTPGSPCSDRRLASAAGEYDCEKERRKWLPRVDGRTDASVGRSDVDLCKQRVHERQRQRARACCRLYTAASIHA